MQGERIVRASWITLGVFVVAGAVGALVDSLYTVESGVYVAMFLASIAIWVYSFLRALRRTTEGDEIAVASWVFLAQQTAPRDVRRHLLGATGASVVVAAIVCWSNPFAVLVPMLHLGFAALWGARYGTYPARVVKGGRR